MALEVVGSNPTIHPIFFYATHALGCSQAVKARGFDSRIRWFDPSHPRKYDSLAQPVEHLTFNQGVRGSNPRWISEKRQIPNLESVFFSLNKAPAWNVAYLRT